MAYDFKNKRILIISPESWGKQKLSKHYYALALLDKGAKVAFMGVEAKISESEILPEGLELVPNELVMSGLRFLPEAVQRKQIKKAFQKVVAKFGPFDLLWSFDNSRLHYLDESGISARIHHVVDFNMDFNLEAAAQSAHLVLSIIQPLVVRLESHPHIHWLNHGYFPTKQASCPKLPFMTGTRNAIILGNPHIPFIDWDFLDRCLELRSDWHIHFYGSVGKSNLNPFRKTEIDPTLLQRAHRSNFFLRGALASEEIESVLNRADLLVMPYDPVYDPQTSNSHKMMQYLASGTPVVSHYMAAYKEIEDALYMDNDLEKRLTNYTFLMQEGENELKKSEIRTAFAQEHSYDILVDRIGEWLNKSLET